MEELKFENAYYIKLGEKGKWAEESIAKGIVRIGWSTILLEDINNGNQDTIRKVIKDYYDVRGKKNGSKQDYNALKRFVDATENDVFITFYENKMFWCNLVNGPVELDTISKFKETKNGWSCNPINSKDKIFYSNEISGTISKTQAFQGTLCKFNDTEIDIIFRIINGIQNPKVAEIDHKKKEICTLITSLVNNLHWKDCEILTDLIFQQSGWRRISMPGGSLEFMDMEYYDPINNERYIVQVKSGANLSAFKEYENKFNEMKNKLINSEYRKLFFVAYHPDKFILNYLNENKNIEILLGNKLSEMIFDLGLLNWVLKKSN